MGKNITATAIIAAKDDTGATFDKIAGKMQSIQKAAKSFEGIKGPQEFFGKFNDELTRLKLSEKELQSVRKSFGELDRVLKSSPVGAANYFRAVKDWQGKTVDHWREVKSSINEADVAHKKFFKNAGHFARHTAAHVLGGFGAAYVAGHTIKKIAGAAGARNREGIREEIAGFTPEQQGEANRVADEISMRHTSLSRTDILEDLRKNTARLGTLDRAKEIAETYAKARVFNQMVGGDEHELEQVVRAAEGAGAANTPDQFKSFLNGFAKARARNKDYTGDEFAKDFRAAGAAKYGLGKDYMENVFPVLASHTPGFGVKLGTSNSALIGGRMTKHSRAAMEAAGLWKDGHLVGEREYQNSPSEWIQSKIRPLLEAKGVHFGEHMSVEDKQTVSSFASKTFSAKNVADLVIASLLDQPLVEKYRQGKGKDIDSVDEMQHRDASQVWQGVTKQLGDLGAAATNTSFAIGRMDSAARALAGATHFLQTGEVPPDSRGGRIIANAHRSVTDINEQNRIEEMEAQSRELDQRLVGGQDDATTRELRLRKFKLQSGIDAAKNAATMPPIFSDAEKEYWEKHFLQRSDGQYTAARRATFGNDAYGPSGIPLPMSDPRKAGVPAVQSLEVSASDLKGDIGVTVKVEAGSSLIAIEESVKSLVARVSAMLHVNGPGSAGLSSTDAAAPARPSPGAGTPGY